MFDRLTSSSRIGSTLAVLGAVLMLLSVAAPAMAAAPVVDTETTNTGSTSDATDGATIATNFTANSSSVTYVEAEYDSDNPGLRIIDPATNETIRTYAPSDFNETYNDSANSTWHFARNVSHDELSQVPMSSGENKSVTMQFVDNVSLDEQNQSVTNITVYIENVNGRTVLYVGQSAAASDTLTLDSDGITFDTLNVSVFDNEFAEYSQTGVAINGSGSTVTLAAGNNSMAERLSASAQSADAGDWVKSTILTVDNTPVKVYNDQAPDSVDTSTDTYAVYDSASDEVTIHYGDDYQGETTSDVTMTANKGFGAQFSTYGLMLVGASSASPLSLFGTGALLSLSGLFVIGRPQINRGA